MYLHWLQTVKKCRLFYEHGKMKRFVPEAHPTQTLSPINRMHLAPAISNRSAWL